MIYSMTAFARVQNQGDWGSLVCELRSINHRYLEIGLYLPEPLRALETLIREQIRAAIKRGKIECTLRYQSSRASTGSMFNVNTTLVQELCYACESMLPFLQQAAPIQPADILRFPGVLETKEMDIEILKTQLTPLLQKTLDELLAARQREGKELQQLFLQRIDLMQQELAKIRQRLPSVLVEQRDKLIKRFTDAKLELDPTRLEQEMVIFAQRMDVAEEIDRTETHLNEFRRILKEGGLVGRRLDFLLQELNREANTLGSKSSDTVLTHAAVEMKVLIEQIREQVQNIE
jgi:uncharacterized protein (TIGR00255 family)